MTYSLVKSLVAKKLLVQVRFQYLWAASSGEGFGRLVGHQVLENNGFWFPRGQRPVHAQSHTIQHGFTTIQYNYTRNNYNTIYTHATIYKWHSTIYESRGPCTYTVQYTEVNHLVQCQNKSSQRKG